MVCHPSFHSESKCCTNEFSNAFRRPFLSPCPRFCFGEFVQPKKAAKKGGKKAKGKKDKADAAPEVTEWDAKSLAEMEEDRKTLQEAIVDSRMKRNYFEQERVRLYSHVSLNVVMHLCYSTCCP